MRCIKCGADLATGDSFCPKCGTRVANQPQGIPTRGGATFAGPVTAGRDVIGGDQINSGSVTNLQGLQGADLARFTDAFRQVYAQAEQHARANPDADPDLLQATAKKVEQEAVKGEQADTAKIKRWLNTLAGLAPDVLEIAVNALTNPGAAVASGVKLVARGFQRSATGSADQTTN
jgi:predicted  nucleic acid-binding Zn-ribbon protein